MNEINLLILLSKSARIVPDEITNNLDLETRGHVIDVLKNFPGAMIIISHDTDFLEVVTEGIKYSCFSLN